MNKGMIIVYTGASPEREMPSLGLLLRNAGYTQKGCVIDFMADGSPDEVPLLEAMREMAEFFPPAGTPCSIEDAWNRTVAVIHSGEYVLLALHGLTEALASGRLDEQQVLDSLSNLPPLLSVIIVGAHVPQSLIDLADVVTDVHAL